MNSHYVFDILNDNIKKLTIPALLLIVTTPVNADWKLLKSNTLKNLNAVHFPLDDKTGYVAGDGGLIMKTSDEGINWKKLRSGTKKNLLDVEFKDRTTGYAVGINGIILKTTNAGKKWNRLDSGTNQHLYTIHFPVDSQTGYAGGAVSTLLKTVDGGETWKHMPIGPGYIRDIVFPNNNNTGYASAIDGSLGYVYKTNDGGNNWTKVLDLEDAFIESMSFPVDDTTGFVVNSDDYIQQGIWKTVNGGESWNLVTPGITSVPIVIDFPQDDQYGVAVGKAGSILTTSDSGNTWTEGNLGINHRMQDIDLINNNSGYAVGRQGVIYKTKGSSVTPVNNIYMHPSVMGSINSFTDKSGCTVDWDCVNDQSSNLASGLPEAVNSNDYVADGNGNRVMFALEDGFITTNQQVTKICLSIAATQFTGPRASLSYQRSGIDLQPIDSVVFWIGSYWYNGMTTHCWSNLNWTSKDIDALEIGVKSVEGNWIEISQMYVKVFVLTP